MTVTTQSNKTIALGNGVDTVFAFSFIGVSAASIAVILTDSDGVETDLGTSLYTLALNAAVSGALWGVGGTVTYPLTGSPIPSGSTLTIYRTLSLVQAIALQNQASYGAYATAAEQGLDILEMQLQQVSELFQRAIVAPIVDPDALLPLPAAAQRANLALIFDADGNPTAGAIPASGTISSAMQPVVGAASLAAGRMAFGLGTMAVENIGAGLQDDGAGAARVIFDTVADAAPQSVVAAFHLTQRFATGGLNYTLARSNTLWDGFGFWLYSLNNTLLLTPDSHDSVMGSGAGVAYVLPAYSTAFVTTDGAASGSWRVQLMPRIACEPQGYLTLTSSLVSPVTAADVTAATSVYYTPFKGNLCAISDGLRVLSYPFAQQTLTLNSNHVASNLYDVFAALDTSGNFIIGAGPSWLAGAVGGNITAGSCARGTGVGSSELERFQGFLVNKNAVTLRNGATTYSIAVDCAVYLGSVFIDGSAGQVTCTVSYGQSRKWGVWNAFNRVPIILKAGDPTATWPYTTATIRASRGQTANSLQTFCGLAEEASEFGFLQRVSNTAASVNLQYGIGYNSTIAFSGYVMSQNVVTSDSVTDGSKAPASYQAPPSLGINTITSLEFSQAAGTSTWNGTEAKMLLTGRYRG